MNNFNDEENDVVKAYYKYIGQKHYENLIAEVDMLEDVDFDFDALDIRFNTSVNRIKKKERIDSLKKHFKAITKTAAIILITMCIGFTVILTSVEAFRIKFYNIFVSEEKEYTQVNMIDTEGLQIDEIKNMNFFPPNTILLSYTNLDYLHIIEYGDNLNNIIKFTQSKEDILTQLDSEEAHHTKIDINDNEGIVFKKNDVTTLYWNYDNYSFCIRSTFSLEIIKEMAESVK